MIDFKFCEIDDNYVPVVEVEGEYACQYCYEAYGEINQPQCLPLVLESKKKGQIMIHKVWLYFTRYSWVTVEADTYKEAEAIAWAWDEAGFPKGDERLAKFPQIVDWD